MSDVNADQQAFWTDEAGPVWVRQMQAMDRTLGPVLELLLAQADLRPGDAVLDIGCGSGTSTLRAAQTVGPQGHAQGLDISRTMLEVAQTSAKQMPNASFLLADAQVHRFEHNAFDCMISRFGVMFFADPVAAFANMATALKPGARVVMATWGAIADNPYFTMPAGVVKAAFGPMPKTDPDGPGPFAFRDIDRVSEISADAGFGDITATTHPLDLTPDGDTGDVADLLCDIGPAQVAISHFEMDANAKARLKADLIEALAAYETPQGIRIPAAINIFHARKPA